MAPLFTRREMLVLSAGATLAWGCGGGPSSNLAVDASKVELAAPALAALLDEHRARGLFTRGEMILVRRGRIVARARTGDIPPAARFEVGSVGKAVLAVVVIEAVAHRHLTMETEAANVLDWYPARETTVAALLAHATGLPASATQLWPSSADQLDDYRRRVAKPAVRLGPPFAQSQYYSSGYFLLAQMLEAVCRRPLDDVAREFVFEPLGMAASTFDKSIVPDAESILPIDSATGAVQESVRRQPPIGETGLMTTADDLVHFIEAFRAGARSPLSPSTIEAATAPVRDFDRSMAFWLKGAGTTHGCFAPSQSPRAFAHPGYAGSMVCHDPATAISIVYTTDGMALHNKQSNHAALMQAALDIVGQG